MWLRFLESFCLYAPEGAEGGAGEGGEGAEGAGSPGDAGGSAGDIGGSGGDPGGTGQEPTWRDSISDQKLRASVEKYSSLEDLVASHNKLGGELKGRIKIPGEGATEEDIDRFREQIGVPADTTGYTVPEVEGYEASEADEAIMEELKNIALESGLPAHVFKDFIGAFMEKSLEMRQEWSSNLEATAAEAETMLRTKWGGDFDKNINLAARAAKTFGGDPLVAALDTFIVNGKGKLGDQPEIVEMLANIGRRLDESDLNILAEPQVRASAQERIDQIMKENPPGTPGYTSPAIQAELQSLYKQVAGDKLISQQ